MQKRRSAVTKISHLLIFFCNNSQNFLFFRDYVTPYNASFAALLRKRREKTLFYRTLKRMRRQEGRNKKFVKDYIFLYPPC